MNKVEALETIKRAWNDSGISLYEKITIISTEFYSSGLDLASTAAFIRATPVELDSFLALSELDESMLKLISQVNPPKTTWTMISNASNAEITEALTALSNQEKLMGNSSYTISEFVYNKMMEVSGPTIEQKIGNLSSDDLKSILKKSKDFNVLNEWQNNFFKSIVAQMKKGRTLSVKQIASLREILETLAKEGAIKRNSIDGDQEICNRILDALEE